MTTQITKIPTPRCFRCGKTGEIQMSTTDWFIGKKRNEQGALIQDAFPNLTTDEREQLLTGIHPECWKAIFAK